MDKAFMYFSHHSPMLEKDYPYTSATGDDSTGCLALDSKSTNIKVKNFGTMDAIHGTSSDFKARVHQQPVAVAIAANNKYIHSYQSGVIDAKDCFTD